jgi:23S rRNA (uridine2552-2'-O)-methyltransferase
MTRGKWQDHYARRARDEKWLARSVYKLEEIDRRYKLIREGHFVLDLGCYPGSWCQYSSKKVGPRGQVLGIDLKKPDRFSAPNFRFLKADVLDLDPAWLANASGRRDVVLSDLAPQTSGIHVADTSRSMGLAKCALAIALAMLKKRGHFLCKVFEGEDIEELRGDMACHFEAVRTLRPAAVRRKSREVYLLGLSLID